MDIFDKIGQGIRAVGMSIKNGTPNPFEMERFTSCICFVFNVAGQTQEQFTSKFGYQHIFDSIKAKWTGRKTQGPFYALCPFDEQGQLTKECMELWLKQDLGNQPLIAVIGHCSPGSSVISNDAKDKSYSIAQIIRAINPAFRDGCTIYLTPCNTGLADPSVPGSQSFQQQFTAEFNQYLATGHPNPNADYFTIGTTSMSVPLFGKVHTPEQTYTRKDKPMEEKAYLSQNY